MADDLVMWLRRQLDEDERGAIPKSIVHSGGAPAPVLPNCIGSGTGDCIDRWTMPANVPPDEWPAREREHALTHATRAQRKILAEVAAKRAILELHDPGDTTGTRNWCAGCTEPGKPGLMARMPCQHTRLLALPFADRPGYRDEWRPRY